MIERDFDIPFIANLALREKQIQQNHRPIIAAHIELRSLVMLDTNYYGKSLFPKQVFFPMSGQKEGWSRLAKNLKAESKEDLIEACRETVSLPFEPGDNRRIAVKIVDDRGIKSRFWR